MYTTIQLIPMIRQHILLTAIAGLLCIPNAIASHLTPAEALQRVDGANGHNIGYGKARNYRHTTTIGDLYVFESGRGFMILPDDNRAPAILAYSDEGELVPEGNPALDTWLNFYNRELQYLKRHDETAPSTIRVEASKTAIAPLIKTEWNQESPYNMLCPKVNGHDVVTGCVATAMAQFMKYYDYPPKGVGTHSYYWEVGKDTLTFDYDTTPFQWDAMTDIYDSKSTETAKEAVAELMLACGISVDMHYDIGDSGAATTRMGASLINIFKYSPSLWMPHRDYYGYYEWINMIYDELAQGNPVLYSGQGTAGGHQFICDGYDGNGYFHFNWGWGGLSNGYFLLTALNPDDLGVGGGAGGFNTDQIATLGARPMQSGDKPTYIIYNSGGFVPQDSTVKVGDDLTCGGIYFNYSMETLPEGSVIGMKFTNADTGEVEYVRGSSVAGMRPDEGRYWDIVKFPNLADGTYYITPALHADDKWWEIRMPLGTPDRITATVSDGTATLGYDTDATISIEDIVVPPVVYAGHDFPLKFTGVNNSDLEYYAKVTPYMLDSDGVAVATSTYRPMDVTAGGKETVDDYVANFTATDGQTFGAGDYSLVFRDSAGKDLSTPTTVHVDTTSAATVIKITDFRLITENPVTDPSKVEFSFTVDCESGVYYSCPSVLIFPGDGGYDRASIGGDNHYITPGEKADITVTGNLDNLDDGRYMAAAFFDGRAQTDFVHFELKRINTMIDILDASASSPHTIYTLDGIPRQRPLAAGIYIIDGKITIVR